jgi:hypothetical protein
VLFSAVHMSLPGTSHHFAAEPEFGRYRSKSGHSAWAARLGSKTLAESSLSGKARGEPASADGKPHSTSGSIQGLGYLLAALRRQRLASDKLVLQLAAFLRSHDLFLELSVRTPRTPRTLTANQVRHSSKQSTDGRQLSRIHSSACPALTSTAEPPAQRLTISLTPRSFLEHTVVLR